ncbi:MAG TPA: hypothetical protein VGO60_01235 [Iamia sp.]|nr:hypothetical protein [Iamia sp.]
MGAASVVTRERSWFGDADRRRRTLRLTPHPRQGVTTLSLWDDQECTGTIRLAHEEVPALISALAESLAAAATQAPVAPPLVLVPPGPPTGDVERWMHARSRPGEPATSPPVNHPTRLDAFEAALERTGQQLGQAARRLVDRILPPPH